MEVKEILKTVKKLQIKTAMKSEGLVAGAYHSIFRGRGIDFSEAREYVPGDDIRSIDWNITARMNAPFVKEFIEERDLSVYIVFDVSGSADFGSEKSKKDASLEAAASLIFAALSNNDRVGLCMFSSGAEKFIPSKKGRKHALRLLREMAAYSPKNSATNLESALMFLSRAIKTKSIIFVISDFISGDFSHALKLLKSRHDVVAVKIGDAREEALPDIGYVMLEDSETGEQMLVNTSDPEVRKKYAEIAQKNRDALGRSIKKARTDVLEISATDDAHAKLRGFFAARGRRR